LEAQKDLSVQEFLDLYVAVKAHSIELKPDRQSTSIRLSNEFKNKTSWNGEFERPVLRSTNRVLTDNEWCLGGKLIDEFICQQGQTSAVGATLRKGEGDTILLVSPNNDAADVPKDLPSPRLFPDWRVPSEGNQNLYPSFVTLRICH
jgi:hypothetical protein